MCFALLQDALACTVYSVLFHGLNAHPLALAALSNNALCCVCCNAYAGNTSLGADSSSCFLVLPET